MADVTSDIIIVGGSLGGVAAALRAAEMGASVCLIEEAGWVGGQLTSQGVCTPDETLTIENGCGSAAYLELRHNIRQHYKDNYPLSAAGASQTHFNPGDCWVGYLSVEPKVARDLLLQMIAQLPSITLYLNARITEVETNGPQVTTVIGIDEGNNPVRFIGRYFLDATDMGELLPLAGVEFTLGADSQLATGEPNAQDQAHPDWVQPVTVPFALERRPFGENNTIPQPDQYEAMKAQQRYTVLDGGIKGIFDGPSSWWSYRRIISAAQFNSDAFPYDISTINTAANDYLGAVIPTANPAADAQTMQLARLASLGYVYWLQTECPREDNNPGPGYPELKLRMDIFDTADGLAPRPYIRESRRIRALRTIVEQDILAANQPDDRAATMTDSCGIGWYWLDVHKGGTPDTEIFLDTKPFQIPLGSLIPIRMNNLLPACKNIGLTHLTNGAYRLHPVEWSIGEASGALAAFCVMHGVLPRDVYGQASLLQAYQQSLLDAGNPIYWWTDVPAGHPAFVATQWLGMMGIFTGSDGMQFKPEQPMSAQARQNIEQRMGQQLNWPPQSMTRAQAAIWLYGVVQSGAIATTLASPVAAPMGVMMAAMPAAASPAAAAAASGLTIAPGKPAARLPGEVASAVIVRAPALVQAVSPAAVSVQAVDTAAGPPPAVSSPPVASQDGNQPVPGTKPKASKRKPRR